LGDREGQAAVVPSALMVRVLSIIAPKRRD